jgi:hypothetical protein
MVRTCIKRESERQREEGRKKGRKERRKDLWLGTNGSCL